MANVVTVACKLPNGLRIPLKSGEVVLRGANARKHPAQRFGDDAIGGYGLTVVDADEFKVWFDQAKKDKFEPVVQELIFVSGSLQKATDEALEKKAIPTGFEGVNQDKPREGVAKADTKED